MDEAEEVLEQLRTRAARDGMAIEVRHTRRTTEPLWVNVSITTNLKVWMRMGAKIALAAASVAYPTEWRTGLDANYLRRLLRDGEDGGRVLMPEAVDDGHVFRQVADPPEHVLWFNGQEPTKLAVVLFGELFFAMPVHAEPRRAPSIAWRLDPRRPRASGQTTEDKLLVRALERANAELDGRHRPTHRE
jgi:hypothetical protein